MDGKHANVKIRVVSLFGLFGLSSRLLPGILSSTLNPFSDPALQDYVETAYGYRNPANTPKFAPDFRDAPTSAQNKKNTNKKSSTGRICSSITGILTNEIGKTKNKTKLSILQSGLKYANEVCDAGGVLDLVKITKGLPEKDKLRISQKTNSALFDGKGDLPDKDFGPDSSNPVALTGKGGSVGDLKAFEPDLNKVGPVTDFSLNKPTTLLASAKIAASTQKAEAVLNPGYDECVKLRNAAIEILDKEIKMYEDGELIYQNVLKALMKGEGACAPASVALNPEDCSDAISAANDGITNMQAGIANAQAKKNDLPTEIESCGCSPGLTPTDGTCKAEPEAKPDELEIHEFPYGVVGLIGVIAGLLGAALIAGKIFGLGWLVLIIGAIISILGPIIGFEIYKRWAKRRVVKNEKMKIKRAIDAAKGLMTLSELQNAGLVAENDALRKMGFTDEDIKELEDYAKNK
ncbi:MAG: hypothetical protein KKH28_09145 [Elusimicrobia bacterium]|nr:hypothetical protein [Elusimicrobiota bacterium]